MSVANSFRYSCFALTAVMTAGLSACQESTTISASWKGPTSEGAPDLGQGEPVPAFALTTVLPQAGSNRGSVQLTLQGRGFVPGSTVWVDGVAAANTVVVDPTKLTAALPARPGALGRVPIAIELPDGQKVTRKDLFSYYTESIDYHASRAYFLGEYCSTASGDFDGDGKIDIAAAYGVEKSVKVFSNDGLGWLSESHTTSIPSLGRVCPAMASGDFDGDGDQDLALISYENWSDPATVSILLGDGKGGFAPKSAPDVGREPSGLLASDLNGDALVDLIVLNRPSDTVRILLGDGTGGFKAAEQYTSLVSSPADVAAGDVDGDGLTDLTIINSNEGNLVVLHGLGMGKLGRPASFKFTPRRISSQGPLQLADFNGDHWLDIGCLLDGHACVLLNDTKGNFLTATCPDQSIDNAAGLVAADIDGDRTLDLLSGKDGILQALYNDGAGNFRAGVTVPGNAPISGLQADYDGDGKLDVAMDLPIYSSRNRLIGVMLGEDKPLAAPAGLEIGAPLRTVVAADLDADGLTDLAGSDGRFINCLRNGGGGKIKTITLYNPGFQRLDGIEIANLNRDRQSDIFAVGSQGSDIRSAVLLSSGRGQLSAPQTYDLASYKKSALGLLNDDNYLDLAVASAYPGNFYVMLGSESGGFIPVIKNLPVDVGWNFTEIAIADFNGDKSGDLAVSYWSLDKIVIMLGDKNANFSAPQLVETGLPKSVGWMTSADFNGDGFPDIAVGACDARQAAVLLNKGDGSFTIRGYPFVDCSGLPSKGVLAVDLNGDGRPELVSKGSDFDTIGILLNNRAGGFGKVQRFIKSAANSDLTVGDWDGDGKPDLLLGGTVLTVVRNQSR